MDNSEIIKELKTHSICLEYWDDQIESALKEEIKLKYEPVGTSGIYSKYYRFLLQYHGVSQLLVNSDAIFEMVITSTEKEYNLKNAKNGLNCFHNVHIRVRKNNEIIISCHFRLWEEDEELSGKKSILKEYLHS